MHVALQGTPKMYGGIEERVKRQSLIKWGRINCKRRLELD